MKRISIIIASILLAVSFIPQAGAQEVRGSTDWTHQCSPVSTTLGKKIMDSRRWLQIGSRAYETRISVIYTISGAGTFVTVESKSSADANNFAMVLFSEVHGNYAPFSREGDGYIANVQLSTQVPLRQFHKIAILDRNDRLVASRPFNLVAIMQDYVDSCD